MKRFVFGVFTGWIFLLMGGYLFVFCGGMPVATKGPPLPLEKFIAKTALHAAFKEATDVKPPFAVAEADLVNGAKVYVLHCAVCHSLPNQESSLIAKGMFPPPPNLFKHGVDDDPIGETYWKVKNGIRLTGMPGFEGGLSDKELWQVSALLAAGEKLPASAQTELLRKSP